jgi:hypothetical protein
MEQNPFEYQGPLSNLLISLQNEEENLDVFISEMKEIKSLSYKFNPLHHRVVNQLFFKLTNRRKKRRPSDTSELRWDWYFLALQAKGNIHMFFMPKTIPVKEVI